MRKLNKFSRPNKIYRFVIYICILTTILYIGVRGYHYSKNVNYSSVSESSRLSVPYNEFIDQNGVYRPYAGYKILQLVKKPIPSELTELNDHLNQQNQLKLYFKLVSGGVYHVTLTNLKNHTSYPDKQSRTTAEQKHVPLLNKEQAILDEDELDIISTAKQLLMINKTEIRIQLEMNNDKLKEYQERWKKSFPEFIIEQSTSFHLTIAYQYRPIPDKEIYNQLEAILKQYTSFPFEIPLDPIEICSYNDMITYIALVPDVTETEINN